MSKYLMAMFYGNAGRYMAEEKMMTHCHIVKATVLTVLIDTHCLLKCVMSSY